MAESISKIIIVLNNFEKVDKIFKKAVTILSGQNAVLEVLYIHEESLFELPDFFCLSDSSCNNDIDKEKIKEEINKQLLTVGYDKKCPVFVFINDTVDHLLTQIKNPQQTLVLIAYQEKVIKKLLKKCDANFLIIKNDKESYNDIVIPVDLGENSITSVNMAKSLFSQSKIRLLYDNYYVLLDELKQKQKERFEVLKKETQLDGDYIQEHFSSEMEFVEGIYTVEKHLAKFINDGDFDLAILYSEHKEFLFSNSISFAMLEMIQTDMLLL